MSDNIQILSSQLDVLRIGVDCDKGGGSMACSSTFIRPYDRENPLALFARLTRGRCCVLDRRRLGNGISSADDLRMT